MIGYVYKAWRYAFSSRVNDVISGFRPQVAYFFYLIVLQADVGFYGLVPLPSKTNPFLIIVE